MPLWLRRLLTFHGVAVAWVLFRAGTLTVAAEIVRGLASGGPLTEPFPVVPLAVVLLGFLTHGLALRFDLPSLWGRTPRVAQGAAYAVIVVLLGLSSVHSGRFIYFQF